MLIDSDDVIQIIRDVARTEIIPRFRTLSSEHIYEKSPGDLVTLADLESEKKLSKKLSKLLPGSVVVGEEGVAADPRQLDLLKDDNPVWILDPIDGTHNFAHGKECFAVIVALYQKGQTLQGWIHDPVENTTVIAAKGEGAWENGSRLSINPKGDIMHMTGSLSAPIHKKILPNPKAPTNIVRYRCVGREYMDLARGKLDFSRYARHITPWDHAAGVLIHKEAGGYASLTGQEYTGKSVV